VNDKKTIFSSQAAGRGGVYEDSAIEAVSLDIRTRLFTTSKQALSGNVLSTNGSHRQCYYQWHSVKPHVYHGIASRGL
jgi:hypothetical protein